MLVKSKPKYLHVVHGTFRSASRTNSASKKFLRDDKTSVHMPKKAKYVRHPSGSWWGRFPKRRHS